MQTLRVPLAGTHNQRSIDGTNALTLNQDQQFMNCVIDVVKNPITGKSTFYIEKRPGWSINTLVSAGNVSTGLIKTDILNTVVSGFAVPNSTIYDNQTSVGTITGEAIHFYETSLGAIGYVMIRSSDGTGWYYASDSKTTLSYTGTTHTNATLDSLGSTAGMYSGQLIAKADVPVGTRILSVDSATSVTMNANATGSATGAVTKEPIAKILDTDFVTTGTNLSGFTDLNGYLFYCAEDGYVYNSNLNTVHLYDAANRIPANIAADLPAAIAKTKSAILCLGRASTEYFHNAGNPAGSPLNSDENLFKRVGIQNQRSMAQLQDDIYFVSASRDGDLHVEKISNLSIDKVSSAAIDKIIGTANATGSYIYVSAFTLGGYSYVLVQVLSSAVSGVNYFLLKEDAFNLLLETGDKIITDLNQSVTNGLSRELIFNADLNFWSEWNSPLLTFVKGVGAGSINQIIASSRLSTSGKIYGINPSSDTEVYSDDGTLYDMIIRTSAFDLGTDKWKYIHSISWIGDEESEGTVLVESSDDDYQTWVSRGSFDLTKKQKKISGVGAHKGSRAYRFTHSSDNPCRGQAVDIEYSVGAM